MWLHFFLLLSCIFLISFILCCTLIYISKNSRIFIDNAQNNKPQRFHTSNTSRAGGVGIFGALMVGFFVLFLQFFDTPISDFLGQFFMPFEQLDSKIFSSIIQNQALWLCAACFVIFLSGLSEDFSSSISPKLRLVMQCCGAFLACYFAQIYIFDLDIGFILPYWFALVFSIFALVGVSNAINIIDGFNGLAGGVCVLIFSAVAFVAFKVGDFFAFFVAVLTICAVLGFLVLNFPKGKIFLGDGGAYFLGFLAGFLLVEITQGREEVSAWFGLAVMIYPVWEVLFSIFRKKFKRGKSPMQPDGVHFHMLIFKRFTKNNSQTSIWIVCFYAPFVILACIFSYSSFACIAISAIFALIYTLIYTRFVRFGKII